MRGNGAYLFKDLEERPLGLVKLMTGQNLQLKNMIKCFLGKATLLDFNYIFIFWGGGPTPSSAHGFLLAVQSKIAPGSLWWTIRFAQKQIWVHPELVDCKTNKLPTTVL